MRKTQRTRVIDWIGCGVVVLVGLFFLAVSEFARRYGTTPKEELTVNTGRATDATLSQVQGRYGQATNFLRFAVAGQVTEYGSDMPGFARILQAVQNGEALTLGVSTKRETVFPRNGWAPLYSLSIGAEQVVTYEDTIEHRSRSAKAPFIVAGVLLLIGGWGLHTCYSNRHAPVF